MTPEDPDLWNAITEHFGAALDLPPEARARFLERLWVAHPAAAQEVASLLDEHDRCGEFLSPVTVSAAGAADLAGAVMGTYRLVRLIDEGGMGAVYLAERADGAFSKQVAVKVLSPAFLFAQDRFRQEREFLARLDHPNIARLLDGGTTPAGLLYLVLEYVEGVPVTEYCGTRDVSLDARLELLLQVCAGIEHAHQRLIVHGDIKPANILVTNAGVIKILDFGIATIRDAIRSSPLNFATPGYASPEQLAGEPLTTASDVYAIGALAYEVLTGVLPERLRRREADLTSERASTVLPKPSTSRGLSRRRAREIRDGLDQILLRAVAEDPNSRYASARQLADDIQRYRAHRPVHAAPNTLVYRARKFVGRNRLATALGGLALVSLLIATLISVREARVARRRFNDVRQFAHSIVFEVNDTLAAIPGTTKAREEVVRTALAYLDRLAAEDLSDAGLREELASAYLRVGKVQGGAFMANLGDSAGAVDSFRKAIAAVGATNATPALARLAIEAHINIALLATDPIRSLPEFDEAIGAAEHQLTLRPDDADLLRLLGDAYHGRGTVDHLIDRVADEQSASVREIAVRERVRLGRTGWEDDVALANAMAQLALALEQKADYAGSVAEMERAMSLLQASLARNPGNQVVARLIADLRSREGSVLLAMGRLEQSRVALEAAMRELTPIVDADKANAQYRGDLAYTWFRLGETLRAEGKIADALEMHRRALDVRRERVSRDPALTFIRWELSRSLNAVGGVLLAAAPPDPASAAAMFVEARELAVRSVQVAPSFIELQKEAARSDEGLARAALLRSPAGVNEARQFLERSLRAWEDIVARGSEDLRDATAPARVRAALASLPAARPPHEAPRH